MEKPTKGTLLGLKLIQDWLEWQLKENKLQIEAVEKELNEQKTISKNGTKRNSMSEMRTKVVKK